MFSEEPNISLLREGFFFKFGCIVICVNDISALQLTEQIFKLILRITRKIEVRKLKIIEEFAEFCCVDFSEFSEFVIGEECSEFFFFIFKILIFNRALFKSCELCGEEPAVSFNDKSRQF